jgi:hypothetical protein
MVRATHQLPPQHTPQAAPLHTWCRTCLRMVLAGRQAMGWRATGLACAWSCVHRMSFAHRKPPPHHCHPDAQSDVSFTASCCVVAPPALSHPRSLISHLAAHPRLHATCRAVALITHRCTFVKDQALSPFTYTTKHTLSRRWRTARSARALSLNHRPPACQQAWRSVTVYTQGRHAALCRAAGRRRSSNCSSGAR